MGKIIDFFKKHPIIKTLVLMIIVFFLLIALTLYGLKLYTRHGKAVIVPEVKTMILPTHSRSGRISVRHNRLSVYRRCGSGQCHRTDPCWWQQSKRRSNYLSIDQRLLPQNDFLSKSLRYVSSPSSFHLRKCRVDRY